MAIISNPTIPINFFYLDIFLSKTINHSGLFNNYVDGNNIYGSLTSFTFDTNTIDNFSNLDIYDIVVTGLTTNKLESIKTYSGEYKIGINGVEVINDSYIIYTIDNIKYKTFFSDLSTIYTVIKKSNEFENNFIIKDDNIPFIDIKKTINTLFIDRSNISVYDFFNRLNNVDNLDDLLEIYD